MKTILYAIHGYGSTGVTSSTINALKSMNLDGIDKIVAPTYDPSKPDEAAKIILDGFTNCSPSFNDVIVFGISLGGFWANWLVNKFVFNIKTILVNPSVYSHVNLRKYIGENNMTEEVCQKYSKYFFESSNNDNNSYLVLVSLYDPVVPASITIHTFKNKSALYIDELSGHRFENLADYKDKMESLINNP